MTGDSSKISIVVVDDHQLFRDGLITLIKGLDPRFKVIAKAKNGKELIQLLETGINPDLILLDLNMPVMDGKTTVRAVKSKYPAKKVLILSMKDDESTYIDLLKKGANGFLSKDVEPEELRKTIIGIHEDGYYYSEFIAGKLINGIQPSEKIVAKIKLNKQELQLIELVCSDYTYNDIAMMMNVSMKSVDGYRAQLFKKFNVKSRVGLVIQAIKNKYVLID